MWRLPLLPRKIRDSARAGLYNYIKLMMGRSALLGSSKAAEKEEFRQLR